MVRRELSEAADDIALNAGGPGHDVRATGRSALLGSRRKGREDGDSERKRQRRSQGQGLPAAQGEGGGRHEYKESGSQAYPGPTAEREDDSHQLEAQQDRRDHHLDGPGPFPDGL